MDRQLPGGDWFTGGRVSSCKVSRSVVVNLRQTFNPSLAWKIANVFKMNGDDDDEAAMFVVRNINKLITTHQKRCLLASAVEPEYRA